MKVSPKVYFSKAKNNKKIKETWLDYYYRNKAGRCEYCNLHTPKDKCVLVRKNDDSRSKRIVENRGNIALVCKNCKCLKRGMNHVEFLKYIKVRNKRMRRSIKRNRVKVKEGIFQKYNGECIFCVFEFGKTPMDRKNQMTIEHKKPLRSFGDNSKKNLACSCYLHNNEKKDMTATEFFDYLTANGRKYKAKRHLRL